MKCVSGLVLILPALWVTALWPQTPAPRRQEDNVNRRVSIDVVVTDKSGTPVSGLQQQDFILLDQKQPQQILSFRAEEGGKPDSTPQQVVLLLDGVNTAFQGVTEEVDQLKKLLRQDSGHLSLPTSLSLVTDTSQRQSLPSQDGNALIEELESNSMGLRTINRSSGFYGGVERVQISINALEKLIAYLSPKPGRKLLVWLSPGWPLLSGPRVDLTKKNQEFLFDTVVKLSAALREARITLYSVDPLGMSDAGSFRTFYYQSYVKGVTQASKVENGNLGLGVLAVQSGGMVLNSSNDVSGLIARCLQDSKAFYTISFDAPRPEHANEYHSLEVKIGKPGLTARTRTGYYAQQP